MDKIRFIFLTTLIMTFFQTSQSKAAAPDRIGVNMGPWTQSGTAHFASNIIMNPGFEGHVDRHIAVTTNADALSFSDEDGRRFDDDYWNGATFEIRTGAHAGTGGVITRSLRSGAGDLPQFFVESPLPVLEEKTVLTLKKTKTPAQIDNWWIDNTSTVDVDNQQIRPGSEGEQSLRLHRTESISAKISSYIDHIASVAGKSLRVDGKWILTFWAKGEGPNPVLKVLFRRLNGSSPFVNEEVAITTEWKEYTLAFDGVDDGDEAMLQFQLSGPNQGTTLWVDDLWLGAEADKNFFFRKQVVDRLKELKPGFLRELFHLGDSFENRVSNTTNRKAFTVRVKGSENKQWSYGLNNFLDLCEEVGADPWVVIPPPFTDEENRQLGEYLSAHAGPSRFSRVIVEFGNENWNWIYSPLGIPYPKQHGEVADRAIEYIQQGIGNTDHIRFVINGQYANPNLTKQFIDASEKAEGIAIAPYFLFSLDSGLTDQQALSGLFEEDPGYLSEIADYAKARHLEVMVYEVNLHTAEGNAPESERNRLVAGMASGTALAKRIIDCLNKGFDPINIYSFSQYQTKTYEGAGKVKLWGITRNLTTPPYLRPTGLAMKMMNQVIEGETHVLQVTPSSNLTSIGFKGSQMWTAILASKNSQTVTVTVDFPDDGHPLPGAYLALEANSPFDTNEEEEKVRIVQHPLNVNNRTATVTIPPYGLVVLGITAASSGSSSEPPTEPVSDPSSEPAPDPSSETPTDSAQDPKPTPEPEPDPTQDPEPNPELSPYPNVSPDSQVLIEHTSNLAINLGMWKQHGTSLFGRNVLMNPGFEGHIDRKIVITAFSDSQSFAEDPNQRFDDQFWNGASFEIRSGPHAGTGGKIARSVRSGTEGKTQYFTENSIPSLEEKTVISLTKKSSPKLADNWWIVNELTTQVDPEHTRPESDGQQSLRLKPTQSEVAEINSYIDHNAHLAGKSLRIEGNWICQFWAKGEGQNAEMQVFFRRINGTPRFFDETIALTSEWNLYTIEFNASDNGDDAILQFFLKALNADTTIWIDDVWLGPVGDQNNFFRTEVIDTLKQLNPSYIRELFHLGDTFDNRTSTPSGRQAFTVLIDGNTSTTWSYSLNEFLDLCERVSANPWIVIPTTFTDEENRLLGQFLAENSDSSRFSEVILEFGHENWNWTYRMLGIPYPDVHGQVADRAFEYIQLGANQADHFKFVINGQSANPELTMQLIDSIQKADGIAIAPNFYFSQDTALSDQEIITGLFANNSQNLKKIATYAKQKNLKVLVSEINLQTTEGSALENERNQAVAGMISASALAKQILTCLQNGFEPIALKKFNQFHTKTDSGKGFVKLSGLTRNLATPPYMRPTGLVMQMINRVIGGELHQLEAGVPSSETNTLTMVGFKQPAMWTAVIVSENSKELTIDVHFPEDGHPMPGAYQFLNAATPFDTNEIEENVTIIQKPITIKNRIAQVTIPPYGCIVLGLEPSTSTPVHEQETIPRSEPEPEESTSESQTEPEPEEPISEPQTEPELEEPATDPTTPEQTTEPIPEEPTPEQNTETVPVEELENKIRELEKKQEEILKELQDIFG